MTTKTKATNWRDWIPDWRAALKIIGYVIFLYVLHVFVILPFVQYVVDSDFFAKNESFTAIEGEGAQGAKMICTEYFKEAMEFKTVEYPYNNDKVWNMEDGRYLVKSSALLIDSNGLSEKVNYTCYVKYIGGDVFLMDSWENKGLDWKAVDALETIK